MLLDILTPSVGVSMLELAVEVGRTVVLLGGGFRTEVTNDGTLEIGTATCGASVVIAGLNSIIHFCLLKELTLLVFGSVVRVRNAPPRDKNGSGPPRVLVDIRVTTIVLPLRTSVIVSRAELFFAVVGLSTWGAPSS